MRVRILSLLIAVLLCPSPVTATAQDPSPTTIVVTPPSTDGCSDVGMYLERLLQLEEDEGGAVQFWNEHFPGVTYVRDMSDEEYTSFYHGLTPEGLRKLADFYDYVAELTAEIEPPPFAADIHRTQIKGMELAATLLREAAQIGFNAALAAHAEELDALTALGDAQTQVALEVCPDYLQVMEYDAER